jgi:hypothetical protein
MRGFLIADLRLPIFDPELIVGDRIFCNGQSANLRFEI